MKLHLGQVNLVSSDVPASVEFYRLLGLTIEDTLPEWESQHRTVEAGEVVDLEIDGRAFASMSWASEEIPNGAMLTFRVDTRDEVDAYYERVTSAGHRGIKPPFDAFWGSRYAIVLDPSGVAVGFMSPMDNERRTAMPDPSTFR